MRAVSAIEGGATAIATSAMIRTPPALLIPDARPVPRDLRRVGKISALYAESTATTELMPQIGMMSRV